MPPARPRNSKDFLKINYKTSGDKELQQFFLAQNIGFSLESQQNYHDSRNRVNNTKPIKNH